MNQKRALQRNNFLKQIKRNYYALPFKIKSAFIVFYLLSLIYIAIVTFNHLSGLALPIYPDNDILAWPYSDGENNEYSITTGSTIIENFIAESSSILLEYVLGDGVKPPFAGIKMWSDTDTFLVDIKKYDYFDIRYQVSKPVKIQFILYLYNDILPMEKSSLAKKYSGIIELTPEDSIECVLLTGLQRQEKDKLVEKLDPGSSPIPICVGIAFHIVQNDTADVPTYALMKLTQIRLMKESRIFLKNLLLSLSGYYGMLTCVLFLSILLNRITLIPYIKPLNPDLTPEKEIVRIQNYIAKCYSDTRINIENTAKNTGIHVSRISDILSSETSMRFNQYLNYVRITAAKEMLKNTDLHILRIALDAGYSNVGHFNRKFRELEKLTPGEYRRKAKIQKNGKVDR